MTARFRNVSIGVELLFIGLLGACATPEPHDYTGFIEHTPRSILVLPPLDNSPEVNACYGCLSTVTRPLAELGYYVFPVAIVDAMMRENGLPTPGEMHAVPLQKLNEIFDPDAVLYLTVSDWGTEYQVINSSTTVTISGVLVDADTGAELWRGVASAQQNSGDAGGGLIGALVSAVANQIATSMSDPSRGLSQRSAWTLFGNSQDGFLYGPHHPGHEESYQQAAAALAESE